MVFITKWDLKKKKSLFNLEFRWKTDLLDIIESFKEKTEGSQIISRDSYILWDYEHSDKNFATKQAKELIMILKEKLKDENDRLEIIHDNFSVIVRPFAVEKVINFIFL